MADNFNRTVTHAKAVEYDQGLRSYMMRVFNQMCIALVITGLASYAVASTPLQNLFFSEAQGGMHMTLLGWIAMFAPIGIVLLLQFNIQNMQSSTATMMLWLYSATMGISITPIFMMYTGESITRVFFITASTFAAMSIYGYTTKRDLTGLGSFLMMGLIGLIIASVVNMFMRSAAIDFIASAIGVLIFTGLTAYDVQRIVRIYDVAPAGEARDKIAVLGALSLYMDFINLFLYMLRFFGDKRR